MNCSAFSKQMMPSIILNSVLTSTIILIVHFKAFLFLNTTVDNDEMEKEFQGLARKYRPKGVKFLIADTENGQHALEVDFYRPFFLLRQFQDFVGLHSSFYFVVVLWSEGEGPPVCSA
jgi:hypothetical protein